MKSTSKNEGGGLGGNRVSAHFQRDNLEECHGSGAENAGKISLVSRLLASLSPVMIAVGLAGLLLACQQEPTPDDRRAMCHALGHEWVDGVCFPKKPEVR